MLAGGDLNVMMTQKCLLWGISSALTHSIIIIVDTDGMFQQYLFECLCASRRCNCSPDEITKSSSTTFTS